jgi:hypothetical protein
MNRVLEEVLKHYVAPEQTDWIKHLATTEFAINNSVNESTGYTPFYLCYGYHPLTPGSSLLPSSVPAAAKLHKHMLENIALAKLHLESAQKRQEYYYDTTRKTLEFQPGDNVLLSTANIGLYCPGSPKLLPKFIGPFKVTARVGELAYKLELPDILQIHNVFHVSRLRSFYDDGRIQPPPLPIPIKGELRYEVEKVYAHRDVKVGKDRFRREYLVRWKGCGVEHDEFLPVANFGKNLQAIREYWRSHLPVGTTGSVDPTEEEARYPDKVEPEPEPMLLDSFDSDSE